MSKTDVKACSDLQQLSDFCDSCTTTRVLPQSRASIRLGSSSFDPRWPTNLPPDCFPKRLPRKLQHTVSRRPVRAFPRQPAKPSMSFAQIDRISQVSNDWSHLQNRNSLLTSCRFVRRW